MPIDSRNKGIRGERLWAEVCQQHGFTDAHRTGQFRGNTGQCADVEGLPYIHQEVKFTEQLRLREAMRQAIRDSKAEGRGNIPIVAHKKNGRPWLVTMTADGFFELYEGYLKYQESIETKKGKEIVFKECPNCHTTEYIYLLKTDTEKYCGYCTMCRRQTELYDSMAEAIQEWNGVE